MPQLQADPDWRAAAQALVSGCLDLHGGEPAVALLESVCRGLGDELYPAFLRVLDEVGQHGDHAARSAVAATLVQALRSGRLPSGRRAAWGAPMPTPGRGRALGPLEYLCAWAAQGEGDAALPAPAFERAAHSVMALVAANDMARQLYCEKLLADAQDSLEGALSRATRQAVGALARRWADSGDAAAACQAFLALLPRGGAAAPQGLAGLAGLAARLPLHPLLGPRDQPASSAGTASAR